MFFQSDSVRLLTKDEMAYISELVSGWTALSASIHLPSSMLCFDSARLSHAESETVGIDVLVPGEPSTR